jgi:hypothetical protein
MPRLIDNPSRSAVILSPFQTSQLPKHVLMATIRASGRTQRCSICNNLDPRGHGYSRQDERSARVRGSKGTPQWSTALSLPIDSRRLSRLTASNCRFCRLLAEVIQEFWPSWSQKKPSVTLNIGWNTPLRVSLVGQDGARKLVEIFSSRGKLTLLHVPHPSPVAYACLK